MTSSDIVTLIGVMADPLGRRHVTDGPAPVKTPALAVQTNVRFEIGVSASCTLAVTGTSVSTSARTGIVIALTTGGAFTTGAVVVVVGVGAAGALHAARVAMIAAERAGRSRLGLWKRVTRLRRYS
jgi:hypothetical protein